jgi:hypothetical protein
LLKSRGFILNFAIRIEKYAKPNFIMRKIFSLIALVGILISISCKDAHESLKTEINFTIDGVPQMIHTHAAFAWKKFPVPDTFRIRYECFYELPDGAIFTVSLGLQSDTGTHQIEKDQFYDYFQTGKYSFAGALDQNGAVVSYYKDTIYYSSTYGGQSIGLYEVEDLAETLDTLLRDHPQVLFKTKISCTLYREDGTDPKVINGYVVGGFEKYKQY